MSEERSFVAGSNDEGRRLDRLIRKMFPEAGLSRIYRSIRRGDIRLNQKRASVHSRISSGDRITLRRGSNFGIAVSDLQALPEDRPQARSLPPSWIVFRNEHLLVLNKPRGILTHGPASLTEMVAGGSLRPHSNSLSFRPGPLQRLDRNTTGLIVFSSSLSGARRFSALLRERKITKVYLALLDGVLTSKQIWTDTLVRDKAAGVSRTTPADKGGRTARTVVTPLAGCADHTLAACRLVTGRTHQIRAQAALHGHPLTGDRKYGGSECKQGYLLHAFLLRLDQEEGELGFHTLLAPLPAAGRRRLASLFGREQAERALLRVSGREEV
jgi:23S rRNA pseudouridine955/2504/2580 synthase